MTDRSRTLMIVALLAVAVAAIVARRQWPADALSPTMAVAPMRSHEPTNTDGRRTADASGLPRLVDLGAQQCIPCRLMAPILDDLRQEYAGALDVVFIDVWKDPDAGTPYQVEAIPTQIFLDGAGRELYRHQGFFAKEDILATWKRLGYYFTAAGVPSAG